MDSCDCEGLDGSLSETKDNWEHRSGKMCCGFCMWFARKGVTQLGRCRKRSPTENGFPAVFETDWCGDNKLDGNVYSEVEC